MQKYESSLALVGFRLRQSFWLIQATNLIDWEFTRINSKSLLLNLGSGNTH